jgi:hypothetical protein
LGTVGPFAALLAGDDSLPLVSLSGAAELVADPAIVAGLRASLTDAAANDALYRLMPDTVVPLRGAMDAQTYADGDLIVRQGEVPDRFYVILQGECEVSRVTGGAPQALAQLKAGNYFGESGLLAGAPRNASVIARSNVTAISLSRTAFSTIMHYGMPTAADLAKAICTAAES